ncbi:hypothetical protein C0J52_24512 [Blattella germanica]|nr:hypothetical protein C0J52_24512 [Blattella germanica]
MAFASHCLSTIIIMSISAGLQAELCKYYDITEFMNCKNINLGEVKPGVDPLNITTLKYLTLHHTGLLRLEYNTFHNQTDLLSLDLSDNLLSALDYRLFMKMPLLESLNLRNNRLVSLTDERIFLYQKKLTSLLLDFNRIKHLEAPVLMPLESLTILFLIANAFVCDCALRNTVLWCESKGLEVGGVCESPPEYTNSSWNILVNKDCTNVTNVEVSTIQIDDQQCNYDMSVELLNCTDVSLRTIKDHTIPKNLTIRTMLFKNCGISNLETGAFNSFPSLDILDLSINLLDKLDFKVFSALNNLRKLILSQNRLIALPGELLKSQKQLQILDLSNNHLTSLRLETFNHLESLQYLNLSGNGFVCNCELGEVMLWCQERHISTGAKCEYPRILSGYSWTVLENYTECMQTTTLAVTTETTPITDVEPMDTLLIAIIVMALLFIFAVFAALWFFCRSKEKVDFIYDDVGNVNDSTHPSDPCQEMKVLKNPLKLEKNENINVNCENTYEEIDLYRNRNSRCASYEIPIHLLGAGKSGFLNNDHKNNQNFNKQDKFLTSNNGDELMKLI